MSFKQALRRPEDGQIGVKRPDDDFILISATTAGREEAILVSEYNASRILVALAVVLGIDITKTAAKTIRL